jgi:hypothetical protein
LAVLVSGDDATTRHPSVCAVFVAQAVADVEFGRLVQPHGLDVSPELLAIIGVNSAEPVLGRVSDLVILTSSLGDPSRREVNPVGL